VEVVDDVGRNYGSPATVASLLSVSERRCWLTSGILTIQACAVGATSDGSAAGQGEAGVKPWIPLMKSTSGRRMEDVGCRAVRLTINYVRKTSSAPSDARG
jgi:hypothetical protein